MALTLSILLTVITSLIALLYSPLKLRAEVLGFTRSFKPFHNIHGEGLQVIPNTVQCEDLHHHLPSGRLFAGCQGRAEERFSWFPPLDIFKDESAAGRSDGGIFVIDTKNFISQRLTLEGFSGPLVTHGIDIYSSPSSPSTLYIFAVNHLPNPAYYLHPSPPPSTPKALSQIEIFSHTLGTATATHLRSITDPLIRTPNDIYATSPSSFYITNDHHYRSGHMRTLEDLGFQALTAWSDVIHVETGSSTSNTTKVTVAYSGLHNPNGFGHGKNDSELLIVSAASGLLHLASVGPKDPSGKYLRIGETVQLPSCIDNPSYYSDPYASSPGAADDASGYVLAGLAQAHKLPANHLDPDALDPAVVWFVQPGESGKWKTRAIFQDDGKVIRTASTAVLVGINPRENKGRKQAWLFVTGFISKGIVATKVDL